MRTWYNFKAKSPDVADLSIFDYIGYYGVEASHFIAELKGITAPTIDLSINSPGGDVFQAIAILNALRGSGKTINVRVLGIAASAAAYITLAGHKRVMPENSMQMLHNASSGMYGNAEELQDMADTLRKVDSNLQATFVTRTGLSAEKVVELLSKDTYLTAAECLELGLCDEVEPALKMTASFETDRLPTNVRALFEAAKMTPTAERIHALVVNAGMGDFADRFAIEEATVEAAADRIETAREVLAYCAVAKVDAAPYINARTKLADVRSAVVEARAAADAEQHVDTTVPQKPAPAAPKAAQPTTASIWAKHRNRSA